MQNSYFKTSKLKHLNTPDLVKKGYTLIELIVVMMIMGIIFSLVTANYRDYSRRQLVVGAARQIKGDLRYTQQLALAGRKPEEPTGNACYTHALRGLYISKFR
jgi:prepilin-type N-terminal cleavage/methylation domain-containing protein